MRFRLLIPLLAAAALALPATAEAGPLTKVVVRSCEVGKTAKERRAAFYARMRAIPGTVRMEMRFTLLDRSGERPTAVDLEELDQWRRSRPGVRAFGYTQRVAGLRAGAVYAVLVDYRWIGPAGAVIKSYKRTSADCRQDRRRPNLTVTRVTASNGFVPGTSRYTIEVSNLGTVAARAAKVELFVDGAGADAESVDLLAPGESKRVHVIGPSCVDSVRAVIDRSGDIRESNEADNAFVSGCPPGAR